MSGRQWVTTSTPNVLQVSSALYMYAGRRFIEPPVGAAGGQHSWRWWTRACPPQSGLATKLLSANTTMTHRVSTDTLIEKATATQSANPHLRQRFQKLTNCLLSDAQGFVMHVDISYSADREPNYVCVFVLVWAMHQSGCSQYVETKANNSHSSRHLWNVLDGCDSSIKPVHLLVRLVPLKSRLPPRMQLLEAAAQLTLMQTLEVIYISKTLNVELFFKCILK